MDRHSRVLAGGCLVTLMGIVLTASGCRSMRNDVPPGKPYSTTGGGPPPVGFNSDPHPNTSIAPGLYGGTGGPGTAPADGRSGGGRFADAIWNSEPQREPFWRAFVQQVRANSRERSAASFESIIA